MNLKNYIHIVLALCFSMTAIPVQAVVDKESDEYKALRGEMARAFNEDDSVEFFKAVAVLQDYCLQHDDLHVYYTQRCNEIVFLLNRQNVFEAYKLAVRLSRELRERNLEKEYFMAINMMGHIYNYCGNVEMAKKCFTEVLERLEREDYKESMPPIFMNLVQVVIDENPEEAMALLDKAEEYATAPDRVLAIDTYRTIYAFKSGDMKAFNEGYQRYRAAVDSGLTAVHGNTLEAYHLLSLGDVKGAVAQANERSNGEGSSVVTYIYERVGDWKNAYESLKREKATNDSINTVILSNSMQGIQNELALFEAEQSISRQRIIILVVVAVFLAGLVVALMVYNMIRRRHIKELRKARDKALESDKMKSAFISNISHEIRTPLNIIGGFMQVMSDPSMALDAAERKHITDMVLNNTALITSLVDEMLELSKNDVEQSAELKDLVSPNEVGREAIRSAIREVPEGVKLAYESAVADSYQIRTNHAMLRKVLNALIDNAIKCTEKGFVTVSFVQKPSTYQFVVEDTGCGVPAEAAERIFERFEKLDDFKEGLGLGLPLARALSRRLGGDVTLDTSYSPGARFVIELLMA